MYTLSSCMVNKTRRLLNRRPLHASGRDELPCFVLNCEYYIIEWKMCQGLLSLLPCFGLILGISAIFGASCLLCGKWT